MDYKTSEYVDGELAKNHFFCESKGLAIIDCMMNLPLLFWAGEVTGNAFYKRIAEAHADTTLTRKSFPIPLRRRSYFRQFLRLKGTRRIPNCKNIKDC